MKLSIKLNLDGTYIPSFNNEYSHLSYVTKKDFIIIGSAHNLKEIRVKEKQKVNRIFISSVFKHNKNYQSGFSFIEVMIGVLIVTIAAYGMVVGATHARGELRAIAVKERATEELLSFVETMKGRIADGKLSIVERSGNLQGETIYLFGNQHSQTKLAAKIFYDPITKLLTDSTSNVDRYLLKSWIEWEDFSTPSQQVVKREEIEMVMMEFPL